MLEQANAGEQSQRAEAAWAALRKRMSDVLRAAVNTKTGRPIPAAVRTSSRNPLQCQSPKHTHTLSCAHHAQAQTHLDALPRGDTHTLVIIAGPPFGHKGPRAGVDALCHAQVLAELWAAEASKSAAVSAAQLRYTRLAARLRTMQASANQRVRGLLTVFDLKALVLCWVRRLRTSAGLGPAA